MRPRPRHRGENRPDAHMLSAMCAGRLGRGTRCVLALAVLVHLAACSSRGGASEGGAGPQPVPVSVAPVVRRDAPVMLHAIGRVEAYATVAVKAQVEGQLASLHFAEGQEVKRGDLLFEIDPRPFEAALHQAEAMLAKNRAEAANARVESGRLLSLIKIGVVSRDEYDQAATRAAAFEAAANADDAAVERARIQLQYCTIHAPIDGRIGQMLVHEGNVVKANETTLAVINQLRPVRVAFAVPQQELPAVRANRGDGQPSRVGIRTRRDRRDGRAQLRRQRRRHDDRDHPPEGGLRERRRGALAGTVRRRGAPAGDAAERGRRPGARGADRPAGHVRLRRDARTGRSSPAR